MRTTTKLYCISIMVLMLPCVQAAVVQVSSDLQGAIDAAAPGDILKVAPGTYGKIEISKSLSLIGDRSAIMAGERDAGIRVMADRVNVSGFLIRDCFYGITLENVTRCVISGNTVIHCAQPGIMLKFSNDNVIEKNNASFNGLGGEGWYGIYLTNSNRNRITANVANGNGAYGINLFPSCNNNTIQGNVLERNMYGLYMFRDCNNNLIESNTMSRNTNSGMDMRIDCNSNLIQNNTVEDNVVAGVTLMEGSKGNIIRDNSIKGNLRYGIQIQSGSDNNTIVDNGISSSQTGIYLESSGCLLYGNRLADNVLQAEDRGSNIWNAAYPRGGNMWSNYLGEDKMKGSGQDISGADKIGDLAYKINERASDKYPLIGNQVQPIKILEKKINPISTTVGNNVAVSARLESRYALGRVAVRAVGPKGVAPGGYAQMLLLEGLYEGTLATALMDPGRYNLELSASDAKGNEIKESLGEIEIMPRGAGSF